MRIKLHLLVLGLLVVLSLALTSGPFGDAIPKREWDEFDPADLHDFERIRPQIDSLELFEDDKILSVEPIAISEEEIDLGKGNMRLLIYFKVLITFENLPTVPFTYVLETEEEYCKRPYPSKNPNPGYACSGHLKIVDADLLVENTGAGARRRQKFGCQASGRSPSSQ